VIDEPNRIDSNRLDGLGRRDNVRNRLLHAIAVAAPGSSIPLPTDSRGMSDWGTLELDWICDSMFGIRSWRTM
jgi:hypothetical protein